MKTAVMNEVIQAFGFDKVWDTTIKQGTGSKCVDDTINFVS
jgi:hypothetical protein